MPVVIWLYGPFPGWCRNRSSPGVCGTFPKHDLGKEYKTLNESELNKQMACRKVQIPIFQPNTSNHRNINGKISRFCRNFAEQILTEVGRTCQCFDYLETGPGWSGELSSPSGSDLHCYQPAGILWWPFQLTALQFAHLLETRGINWALSGSKNAWFSAWMGASWPKSFNINLKLKLLLEWENCGKK